MRTLREFYNGLPYTQHLDFTIIILLFLFITPLASHPTLQSPINLLFFTHFKENQTSAYFLLYNLNMHIINQSSVFVCSILLFQNDLFRQRWL